MMPLIRFRDVSLHYDRRPVLTHVNLDVDAGRYTGIVGPNGAGKTTLLRAMAGILPARHGEIARPPGLVAGYVPQRHTLDPLFPLTARDVVSMARRAARGLSGLRAAVDAAMDDACCRDLAAATFRDLSGGQKQRVLLARALSVAPRLLLLDEPVSDIDPEGQELILAAVRRAHAVHGMTVVMVTHLVEIAQREASQILEIGENKGVRPLSAWGGKRPDPFVFKRKEA